MAPMKKHVLTLIVLPILFLSCSKSDPPPVKNTVENYWALGDTSALVNFIDTHQGQFRSRSESLLRRFLQAQASADTIGAARLLDTLSWSCGLYRSHTNITDLSRKLELYRSWSGKDILQKKRLDSLYRQLPRADPEQKRGERASMLAGLSQQYALLADTFILARVNYDFGILFYQSERYDSAENYSRRALQQANDCDNHALAGECHLLLGQILGIRGDYVAAEKQSSLAIKCLERVDAKKYIPFALTLRADVLFQLGFTGQSRQQIAAAIPLYREFGFPAEEAYCYYLIAENYINERLLDSALIYAHKSSELRKTLQDKVGIGYSLSCEGFIYQHLHDMTRASLSYREAQECFASGKCEPGLSLNFLRRASLNTEMSEYRRARELCDSALALAPDFQDTLFGLYERARCNYYLNLIDSAKQDLFACLSRIERSREDTPAPEMLVGFLADKIGCYDLLARIYIDRYTKTAAVADLDSVFLVLERSRTQSLRDMLRRPTWTQGTEPASQSASTTPASARRLTGDFSRIINLSHCQERLSHDGREILFEYSLSEFGCYLLTLTSGTASLQELPVDSDSLEPLLAKASLLVVTPPAEEQADEVFRQLSRKLFDLLVPTSLRDSLDGHRLIVIPSGRLTTFPFGALVDYRGRYLAETCEVMYCPSVVVLDAISRRPGGVADRRKVVAVGDPALGLANRKEGHTAGGDSPTDGSDLEGYGKNRLPYADREIDSVTAVFGQEHVLALTGERASKINLQTVNYADVRFLHIASHGVTNEFKPSLSAIRLADVGNEPSEGFLYPSDILQLQLATDNVFLSACGSGSGQIYPGEGVISLARPFLVAGSKSVVATLWSIDDRSTAELVAGFYREVNAGKSTVTALVRAQRRMLRSETELYHHPFFWAAFVLIGHGG